MHGGGSMKKRRICGQCLSFFLIFCLLAALLPDGTAAAAAQVPAAPSAPTYTTDGLAGLPEVSAFEYDFLPAGKKWTTLAAGDEPAAFRNVSYELADGVITLSHSVSDQIATAGQLIAGSTLQAQAPDKIIRDGGYIRRSVLDSVLPQNGEPARPGTVVIDPQAGTAFKISASTAFSTAYGDLSLDQQAKALENTYMIEQPQINEVFRDFSVGGSEGEKVSLTRGNIDGFAEHVENCVVSGSSLRNMAFGDALKDYKYLTGDKLINLQFTDTRLTASGSGGRQLTVTLSGGLGISSIDVDAKYSAFGGYHLIMTTAEEFYLVAEVQGTIQEEVRIPLFGIDVPFGIGRVSGGLFLIVGIDGDIRIEADAREYTSARMGVRGKTFCGAPVSAKGVFSKDFQKDGDVDIAGKINGYVKVGPLLDISLLGIDLIGAGAFVGVGLAVAKDGELLDINLYAVLQIYIRIIGKTLHLISWAPSLLRKRQQDTGGYRVHIEEAYIEVGRVGGYIEDTRSASGRAVRVPAGIPYRILVYPAGVDPLTAPESALRIYPAEGWQQTTGEGEFFYEEPGTMLRKGELTAVQFKIGSDTYRSDPVEALFPYNSISISEADYFNDYITGSVAPVRVINYDAQQVAKPGDPADPPEKQYHLDYYTGLLYVQGLSGTMMTVTTRNPLNQKQMQSEIYMPFGQGGIAAVVTDEKGSFDSRNPQMLPEGQYTPVFNGTLQIRPGAVVLGNGSFDYSKTRKISAVRVSFNVAGDPAGTTGYTSSHTILINPIHPLTVSRTISPVANSYRRFSEGKKIVDQMQFDETVHIINGGGARAVTSQEVLGFYEEGWTTQDIADFRNGRFWGSEGDAPVLTQTVKGGHYSVTPVVDENGELTSSVTVTNRVIVEWVWQEHPLPTEITSVNHAAVKAGGSFQAEGRGIRPLVWSLSGAPEGISIDPSTGKITAADGTAPQDCTFTIRLEQDPAFFYTEGWKTAPWSNASFGYGFNKADLQAIRDFYQYNKDNPAMKGDPPVNYIGHYPAPPAEQAFTLTVSRPAAQTRPDTTPEPAQTNTTAEPARTGTTPEPAQTNTTAEPAQTGATPEPARTAPDIIDSGHGFVFSKLAGAGDLTVPVTASGSTPVVWSLEQKSERYLLPEEVTIQPDTGVLTVKEGIEPGTYHFVIRAANDIGFDTQECTLSVISAQLPQLPKIPVLPNLSAAPGSTGRTLTPVVVPCAALISCAAAQPAALAQPSNSTTIRVDHIRDRYTYDRTHVNGAEFVRWDSVFHLNIEGVSERAVFSPAAQMCDSYHVYIDMTDPDLKKLVTTFGKRIRDIQNAKDNLGQYLQKETGQYVTNPDRENMVELPGLRAEFSSFAQNGSGFTTESTQLDFGTVVQKIRSEKGGIQSVVLGGTNGTAVTGVFFCALAENPAAGLEFLQDGAAVTFYGSDIQNAAENTMYDLGFLPQAEHDKQMRSALSDGQSAFICSFVGHGALPGTATFAVNTGISEGSTVNVYRYDASCGRFSLTAGNLTVGAGGVVTYQNNSLSEYLITTETIRDAQVSGTAGQQDSGAKNVWMPAVICLAAGIIAVILIFLRRKKR